MDPESYELLQSICILEQMSAERRLVLWPQDGFFNTKSCPPLLPNVSPYVNQP